MTKKEIVKKLDKIWEMLDKIQDDATTQNNNDAMWEVGEAMGCIANASDYLEREILSDFIEKNYNKVKRHLKQEGKELGYTKNQLDEYFHSTKCFIFAGTKDELSQEVKSHKNDCFIIAEQGDLVIAEMFNGLSYDFI